MNSLLQQETYKCANTRVNKKNWQTDFRIPTFFILKMGESREMQLEDVTAVVWQG